jgi:hypothetical protein
MYEWENEVTKSQIEIKKQQLRQEIKRISNTTLRGNFVKQEDREYWVKKLNSLNSTLKALEEM